MKTEISALLPIPLWEHKEPLNAHVFPRELVVGTDLPYAIQEFIVNRKSCLPDLSLGPFLILGRSIRTSPKQRPGALNPCFL